MSVQQPSVPAASPLWRLRWLFLGAALALGVGGGVAIALVRHSTPAAPKLASGPQSTAITWPGGKRIAPGFALTDQNGKPVSLAAFRGRPVIVTFIDPLCRNLCPLEAKVLDRVVASFPAAQRPAILAVSVNRYADARKNLLLDERKWSLPSDWHWAVGKPTALARVWKQYGIGVSVSTKTIAGVTVHQITHTEASMIVDPKGYERALYLYPFAMRDVVRTIRSLERA